MGSNSGEANDFESSCLTHEMMYGTGRGFCKACNWLLPSHDDECPCSKIRAHVLLLAKEQGLGELRKSFLKQRIFKSDKVRSPISASRRRPGTRPKPSDKRELKWCYKCSAKRISRYNGTQWQCVRCEDE